MGELWGVGDYVAHGEDVGVCGALVAVGDHEATVVQHDVGSLAQQSFRTRTSAHGHHDHVDLHVLGAIHRDSRAALLGRVARDLDAGLDFDPALLEGALHDCRHFSVAARENRRQSLENRDLGPHVAEH